MSRGLYLVELERNRQVEVEGFGPEHDDGQINEELARAAAYYAAPDNPNPDSLFPPQWDKAWAKREKHSRIRQLTIACALGVAELDRQLRLADAAAASEDDL